jgi:hypothetical protein
VRRARAIVIGLILCLMSLTPAAQLPVVPSRTELAPGIFFQPARVR